MEKSQGGRTTMSQRAFKRAVTGLLSIALVIGFVVVASTTANAQVECISACEAQLANCIRNQGNGGSLLGATCVQLFEACVDLCLGQYADVLGI
jgi:hypothetical protein